MSESKLNRLIKTIPSIYNPTVNTPINGILQAWATGDEDIVQQLIETKKQLFVETAEGSFLDSLASNVGVDRPLLIALSDIFFRDLIISLSYSPKQVRKTMYEVLDVFWGPTYSRANITSSITELFDLGSFIGINGELTFLNGSNIVTGVSSFFTAELQVDDFIKLDVDDNTKFAKIINIISDTKLVLANSYEGSSINGSAKRYTPKTLILKVDDAPEATFPLNPIHFADTSHVTATELVSSLSSDLLGVTASLVKTIASHDLFINLRTNTPGSTGSIEIVGGTANTAIGFTTSRVTIHDLVKSTIIYEINPREIIFTLPSLVAKLTRTLKGAIHIHDDIRGTTISVDNFTKKVMATLNEPVFKDQLAGFKLDQDINEFDIVSNDDSVSGVLIDFPVPATTWTVNHDLGYQQPIFTVYDTNGKIILPNQAHAISENTIVLDFLIPQDGKIFLTDIVNTIDFLTPSDTWTVVHNLGNAYVNTTFYDDTNHVIFPNTVQIDNVNELTAYFSVAQSGRVSIAANFIHSQASPDTSWTVNHNLGLRFVNVTVYNSLGELIVPSTVEAIGQNTCTITFGTPQSGFAVIGDIPNYATVITMNQNEDLSILSSNSVALASPTPPSATWNLTHGLNHQYINFSAYNLLDNLIIPDKATAIGNFNFELQFGFPIQGHTYVLGSNTVIDFPVPATTWTVNHDLGTKFLNATIYNDDNEVVIPNSITALDVDNMTVDFTVPTAGHIALSIDFIHSQDIPLTTWTVNHDIGSKFVAVTVYDSSDQVVIPQRVSLIDVNTLEIELSVATTGKAVVGDVATSEFVLVNPKYPNSFIYDTANTFSISKIRTKLEQSITAGDVLVALPVEDASHIPDGVGSIIFNFGQSNQEQPVRYLSRPNNSTLLLDPTHVFAYSHTAGEIINILTATSAYIPRIKGQDYAAYVTGTKEALLVVESILEKIKAVGVVLRFIIDYPSYRFSCSDSEA